MVIQNKGSLSDKMMSDLPIVNWIRWGTRVVTDEASGERVLRRIKDQKGDELISDCGRLRIKIEGVRRHTISVWREVKNQWGGFVQCFDDVRTEYIDLYDMKELARYTYKLILDGHYGNPKRINTDKGNHEVQG